MKEFPHSSSINVFQDHHHWKLKWLMRGTLWAYWKGLSRAPQTCKTAKCNEISRCIIRPIISISIGANKSVILLLVICSFLLQVIGGSWNLWFQAWSALKASVQIVLQLIPEKLRTSAISFEARFNVAPMKPHRTSPQRVRPAVQQDCGLLLCQLQWDFLSHIDLSSGTESCVC